VVLVRSSDGREDSKVLDVAGGDVRELNFALEQSPEVVAVAATPPSTQPVQHVGPGEHVEPVRDPARGRLYRKIALWSLIGAGALAAGTVAGVVLHKREMESYEDALDTPDVDPNVVAAHQTNALRRAVVVDVLGGLTLAAVGTGITFCLLGRRSKRAEGSEVRLGISGSQLLLKGEF